MSAPKLCTFPGCNKPHSAQGLCPKHYQHELRRGRIARRRKFITHGEPWRWLKQHMWDGDGCVIFPYARGSGHGYALVRIDGKQVLASRLVCEAVNGEPPTPEHQAAHLCGKGHEGCVAARHLVWKTHTENQADRLLHGTHNRGERQGRHKLSEADVHTIRARLAQGETQVGIGDSLGVSQQTVADIKFGRTWGWLV